MAISFSNSNRSLQTHDSRKTLAGLIVGNLLVAGWLLWLVFGQISLYQISDSVTITGEEIVTISFSTDANGLIKEGQPAFLRIDGKVGADLGTIPAIVFEINQKLQQDKLKATVFIDWTKAGSFQPESPLTGKIQVEIEKVSPFTLVMRSARSAIETPQEQNNHTGNGVTY